MVARRGGQGKASTQQPAASQDEGGSVVDGGRYCSDHLGPLVIGQ